MNLIYGGEAFIIIGGFMRGKIIIILCIVGVLLAGTVTVLLSHGFGNGGGTEAVYTGSFGDMGRPGSITIENSPYINQADAYIWLAEEYVAVQIGTAPDSLDPLAFVANRHVGGGPRTIHFACGLAQVDMSRLGRYPVTIRVEGTTVYSMIQVVDTMPPTATPVDITLPAGRPVAAEDFVTDVFSYSLPVDIRFERAPNLSDNTQEVTVRLTSAAGNYALYTAQLTLIFNDEPPRIYGARTIESTVGSTILFLRGITAYDAFGQPLRPYVYHHNVNPDVLGRYTVTYAVEDGWGLRTYVTVEVHVIRVQPATVIAMVDDLLERILEADMTQLQQARAIFNWITRNVTYAAYINRRSLYEGAYQGLRHRRGDCFTFYALSELMLTQAGIPNMRISRVGGASDHYWNLVNPDDMGWHHFDTSPHNINVRGLNRFMFTNTEAAAHTAYILSVTGRSHYYSFDPSLYPEIVA